MSRGRVSKVRFVWKHEHLDKSQAIHVPGVHSNKSLLLNLLSVAPWAELKACQLKQSLRCLLGVHPSLNVSQLNTDLWCGLKASQVATVLTHLRRFKTDLVKRTEAFKKATKEEGAADGAEACGVKSLPQGSEGRHEKRPQLRSRKASG